MADICGVLLAAGFSRRYRSNKLLASVNGQAMIQHSAAALAPCARIIAVVRATDAAMISMLNALGVHCVINDEPERGMGYSIACGVGAATGSDGWCLLPADMPYVSASTTQALVDALESGLSLAAPFYQGQRGHPVAFSRRFYEALVALDGDRGARAIVEQYADELATLDCDDAGVLVDIDTEVELERLRLARSDLQ